MADSAPDTIGSRVRIFRLERKMSLEVLAGLAGISKGFLSKVENGVQPLNNRHHVAAIADALRVSTTDLAGQPYPAIDRATMDAQAGIVAIRNVLIRRSLDFAEGTGTRPVSVLGDLTRQASQFRSDGKYTDVVRILPGILDELHESVIAGSEQRDAAQQLSIALGDASDLARILGHHDLAWIAAERARDVARMMDDSLLLALADWRRSLLLSSAGGFHRARAVSLRAADEIDRHGPTGAALEIYGMLHFNAALASASIGEPSDGIPHLDEAANVARHTGEAHSYSLWFGPTNVGIWRMAFSVETGESGKVREIARTIDPRVIPSRSRQAGYYVELGRGLAQTRKDDREALAAFRQAESLNATYARSNPLVRDIVAAMAARAKRDAVGRELHGMAYRMGLTV